MLESLPDLFVACHRMGVGGDGVPCHLRLPSLPTASCQPTAFAPVFNSEAFAFLASGQNRIVS